LRLRRANLVALEVTVNKPSFRAAAWMLSLTAGVALILIIVGAIVARRGGDSPGALIIGAALLAAGCVAMLASLAGFPLALMLDHNRQDSAASAEKLYNMMIDRLQQISIIMNMISEQQLLSDTAKSVAFREKDREVVRRAIQEEISRQDWEAAQALVDDMERQFGYKHEAEKLREEINSRRSEITQRHIAEQMAVLDRHIRSESWGLAFQEAQRMVGLFPNDENVRQLPQQIESQRQTCKKQLLDSWEEAVSRHDVDGSIEILKKLDLYLTPAEAEKMQETARGVFKEKLNLLRMQFSLAVQDRKWTEAIRLGESIVSEFPNSRMAQEVAEKMVALRQRAAAPPELAKA
jgi:outer membrane protein assembly factor BamD (BamD/ComL family)